MKNPEKAYRPQRLKALGVLPREQTDPPPKNLPREESPLGAIRRRDRFLDGLTAEALRHLEKALACDPNHIPSLIALSNAYLDQGVSTEVVQNCPLYVSDMTDMGMAGVRSAAKELVLS